jgi:hypothetical protein
MNLSKINEALDHRITSGSEYGWKCYGENARYLDYESEYAHVSVIYSILTQEVYSAEVSLKEYGDSDRPYRWLNPSFKDAMYDEAKSRKVDADQAWDDIKWIDLETEEDYLEKATAIFNGLDFDTRIIVPINLPSSELLSLMTLAHEKDITFNQLVVELLEAVIRNKDE